MPRPINSRAPNNTQYPGEIAQSTDPTENRTMLNTIAFLRPNRSPNAPSARPPNQREVNAAETSVAPFTGVRSNSWITSVRTSVMMTKSNPSSRYPSHAAVNAFHWLRDRFRYQAPGARAVPLVVLINSLLIGCPMSDVLCAGGDDRPSNRSAQEAIQPNRSVIRI